MQYLQKQVEECDSWDSPTEARVTWFRDPDGKYSQYFRTACIVDLRKLGSKLRVCHDGPDDRFRSGFDFIASETRATRSQP
jgi:hypothetical protein